MEVRYMGFEQRKNAREYQFNVTEKGQPSRHFVVTADLAMFLLHRVAIQEGPTLSASKLTSDLAKNFEGEHEPHWRRPARVCQRQHSGESPAGRDAETTAPPDASDRARGKILPWKNLRLLRPRANVRTHGTQ